MSEIREQLITCINCPVGCRMTVKVQDGQVISVEDNQCKRGDVYARQESVLPLRMVTAVALVEDCETPVSLKTASPIPKDKIGDVMDAINSLKLHLPIGIGDVLLSNAADTGVDLVATRILP
jgi:CxxC motif-containing protein